MADFLSNPDFVPILNPSDWNGREACLCRRLIEMEGDRIPLVAYGINSDRSIEFLLRKQAVQQGWDGDEIEAVAVANLFRRKSRAAWSNQTIETHELLIREGDDLTAVDILSSEVLKVPQEYFQADFLFIGIPNRFAMVAGENPEIMISLMKELYENALRDNNGALTPSVFTLQDGRLTGIAER